MLGERVRLAGLSAKPELNDQLGLARTFHSERGRYGVLLVDSGKSIMVKPDNLCLAAVSQYNETDVLQASARQLAHVQLSSSIIGRQDRMTAAFSFHRMKALLESKEGSKRLTDAGCVESTVRLMAAHAGDAHVIGMACNVLSTRDFTVPLHHCCGAAAVVFALHATELPENASAQDRTAILYQMRARGCMILLHLAEYDAQAVYESGALLALIQQIRTNGQCIEVAEYCFGALHQLSRDRHDPTGYELLTDRRRACAAAGAIALAQAKHAGAIDGMERRLDVEGLDRLASITRDVLSDLASTPITEVPPPDVPVHVISSTQHHVHAFAQNPNEAGEPYRMLAAHGKWFCQRADQKLSDERTGDSKKCFINSVRFPDGLMFCGYAARDGAPPLAHSWNVVDGAVVDSTPEWMKGPVYYFGIPVSREVTGDVISVTEGMSMLADTHLEPEFMERWRLAARRVPHTQMQAWRHELKWLVEDADSVSLC